MKYTTTIPNLQLQTVLVWANDGQHDSQVGNSPVQFSDQELNQTITPERYALMDLEGDLRTISEQIYNAAGQDVNVLGYVDGEVFVLLVQSDFSAIYLEVPNFRVVTNPKVNFKSLVAQPTHTPAPPQQPPAQPPTQPPAQPPQRSPPDNRGVDDGRPAPGQPPQPAQRRPQPAQPEPTQPEPGQAQPQPGAALPVPYQRPPTMQPQQPQQPQKVGFKTKDIVIGLLLAVGPVAIITLMMFFFRWRRKKKEEEKKQKKLA